MSYIITSSDGISATWAVTPLTAAAPELDTTAVVEVLVRPGQPFDLILDVAPVDESGFAVRRDSEGTFLSTDGTLPQAMRVAVWARSLLPAVLGADLWLIDQGFNYRAIVAAGADLSEVTDAGGPITD